MCVRTTHGCPRLLERLFCASLVTIPVEMFNAVETKNEISFRQIHKPSGRRINYTKTVQGIGEVKSADIVKGYEVDQDTYVTLEPEEIDALKLSSRRPSTSSASSTPATSIRATLSDLTISASATSTGLRATSSSAKPCGRPARWVSGRSPSRVASGSSL